LIPRNLDGKIKRCLDIWLVEAWESTASIASFELGAEHVVELVVSRNAGGSRHRRLILAPVEPSRIMVENSNKVNRQESLGCRRELLIEGDGSSLLLGIVAELSGLPCLTTLASIGGQLSR
jgi:hypothetical protein